MFDIQFFTQIYYKILFQILSFRIWVCGKGEKGKDLTYSMN